MRQLKWLQLSSKRDTLLCFLPSRRSGICLAVSSVFHEDPKLQYSKMTNKNDRNCYQSLWIGQRTKNRASDRTIEIYVTLNFLDLWVELEETCILWLRLRIRKMLPKNLQVYLQLNPLMQVVFNNQLKAILTRRMFGLLA